MITVNSVSGGKTSSYMAIMYPADINIFAAVCIDDPKCTPKDPSILAYCLDKLNGNFIASAENDLTLKVMMDLEQILGKEIVWVRGKSFDEIINNAGCLPTWNRRFCTYELKILPIFEYCYFKYGIVKMNIGYRADEIERIIKAQKNITLNYPISCNTHGQQRQNWQEIDWRVTDFPLRKTFQYVILKYWNDEYPEVIFPVDSNCEGCHHKPKQLIKKNYIRSPDKLQWFADQETKKKKKGAKFATWHDDGITYNQIFQMNFTEEIDFTNFTMCSSGGCTD